MMQSKFLIAAITFVMLAAIVVGCAGPSPPPEIGDVVSGNIWQVKVISVKNETTLEADPDIPGMPDISGMPDRSWLAEEGYLFLVVGLRKSNTSTVSQELPMSSLTLTDSEKRVYTPVGWGWPMGSEERVNYELGIAWTATVPVDGEISGETPSDYIVFLVPDDAEGFYFKFQDLLEIYLGQ